MSILVYQTYEFRKYLLNHSVKRVWFYLKAPLSHISYVCEIDPARTRRPGDPPLPEDGTGNKLFNDRHPSWARNDFAYRVRSVRRLPEAVSLTVMKRVYGIGIAPRGMIYTPEKMLRNVPLDSMELLWHVEEDTLAALASDDGGRGHTELESRGVKDHKVSSYVTGNGCA